MPVLFMHDVNAAMLGEMRCGNARGFANAALIALGTGLGFACCLDGKVQYAPTGSPRITVYKKPFRDGILEDYVAKRGFLRPGRRLRWPTWAAWPERGIRPPGRPLRP